MKKLIPAICMTLIAAVMFASSTYAWFSMNSEVTATNMQVTAQSDTNFLLISLTDSAAGGSTSVELGSKANSVIPVAYTTEEIKVHKINSEGTGVEEVSGSTINANSWYTALNLNSNAATGAVYGEKSVTLGDDSYFVAYEFYLTLSSTSQGYTGTLKFEYSLANSGDAAASACIVIGDNTTNAIRMSTTSASATSTQNVTLSSENTVKVTVYMYIDGTSTNVYTDYKNTITGNATIKVSLGTAAGAGA